MVSCVLSNLNGIQISTLLPFLIVFFLAPLNYYGLLQGKCSRKGNDCLKRLKMSFLIGGFLVIFFLRYVSDIYLDVSRPISTYLKNI